jgi:hypothetical protein
MTELGAFFEDMIMIRVAMNAHNLMKMRLKKLIIKKMP